MTRWSEQNWQAWKEREAARAAAPVARSVSLTLPWPPSGNHGTRHANGAHYLTAEHKAFRAKVAQLARDCGSPRLEGRLRLTLALYPADRRRRDSSNVLKTLEDALQHAGLFADDFQISEHRIERIDGTKRGEVLVHIESLD